MKVPVLADHPLGKGRRGVSAWAGGTPGWRSPGRALRGGPDAVCVRCSARPAVQAAEDRSGSPAGRESLGSLRWVWSPSGTASRWLRGGGFARGEAAVNAQPLHGNTPRVSQPGWEYKC